MFEGLTEYIVRYAEESTSEQEQQQGPFGSGRLLADVAVGRTGQRERLFLHDYAYTKFEAKLAEQARIVECDGSTASLGKDLEPGMFVKVKGRATFNDVEAICDMINRFNEFGEAITYVTTQGERAAARDAGEQRIREERDRNTRAKLKAALKGTGDVAARAAEAGLRQDETFLKKIAYLLDWGYQKHFELQIRPESGASPEARFFSALLMREYLREPAALLVKKCSRQAEGVFVLVGMTCQCRDVAESNMLEGSTPSNVREVLGGMVSALSLVEKGFLGRLKNEIIVDPLAVYREV